jgi:hypothetical protein
MQEIDDPFQRRNLGILPQAGAGIGDAAFGCHARRLDDHEAEAAQREAAEMHQVPVVHDAMPRRILAHGRDDGAVLQDEFAERERRGQMAHVQLKASRMR